MQLDCKERSIYYTFSGKILLGYACCPLQWSTLAREDALIEFAQIGVAWYLCRKLTPRIATTQNSGKFCSNLESGIVFNLYSDVFMIIHHYMSRLKHLFQNLWLLIRGWVLFGRVLLGGITTVSFNELIFKITE